MKKKKANTGQTFHVFPQGLPDKLVSQIRGLESRMEVAVQALREIAKYPDNHEGSPEPCSCHYCIADLAKEALAKIEGSK